MNGKPYTMNDVYETKFSIEYAIKNNIININPKKYIFGQYLYPVKDQLNYNISLLVYINTMIDIIRDTTVLGQTGQYPRVNPNLILRFIYGYIHMLNESKKFLYFPTIIEKTSGKPCVDILYDNFANGKYKSVSTINIRQRCRMDVYCNDINDKWNEIFSNYHYTFDSIRNKFDVIVIQKN
jgi:hypothetical protein